MMSLNLKLQSSAAKNQARAVELEIKKLEARERGELLGIVQVGFIFCCLGTLPFSVHYLCFPTFLFIFTLSPVSFISCVYFSSSRSCVQGNASMKS